MQIRFRANLGTRDASLLKHATGCDLECGKCTIDSEHDVPDSAAQWLLERKIVDRVRLRGEAKKAELTAPGK